MGLCIKPAKSYIKIAQVSPQWNEHAQTINTFLSTLTQLRQSVNPQIQAVNQLIAYEKRLRSVAQQLAKGARVNPQDEAKVEEVALALQEVNAFIAPMIQEEITDAQRIDEIGKRMNEIVPILQNAFPGVGQEQQQQEQGQADPTQVEVPQAQTGQVPPMQGDPQQWVQSTMQAAQAAADPQILSGLSVQINDMMSQAPNTQWTQALNSASQQINQMLQNTVQTQGTTTDPNGQMAWNWAPDANSSGAPEGAGAVTDPNAQPQGQGFMGWMGNQLGRLRNVAPNMRRNFQQGYDQARNPTATAEGKPRLTAMMGSSAKYRF